MGTYRKAYRKLGDYGLFDSKERTSKLISLGNPLDRLFGTVDFEMFHETLEKGLYRKRVTNARVCSYDYVLMLKILVLLSNKNNQQTKEVMM